MENYSLAAALQSTEGHNGLFSALDPNCGLRAGWRFKSVDDHAISPEEKVKKMKLCWDANDQSHENWCWIRYGK